MIQILKENEMENDDMFELRMNIFFSFNGISKT